MTAIETLEKLIEVLRTPECKYVDALPYIQLTQSREAEFIGKNNVHAHINGIYSLVNGVSEIKIKEKFTTNKIKRDFIVTFIGQNKVKMSCRLIKESGIAKTDKKGTWGVNINSFKVIKK